jgi:ATP-grasp domain, R2K clade family 2
MLLITQPRAGTSHNEILALQIAARDRGWEVFNAPMGWRLTEEMIASGQKGVPYGSQTFCEVIAQQMNWTLKYNQHDWLAKIHPFYLKRKVEFMTLAEAKLIKETKFIKPADDKVFTAGVYAPGTLITHETIPADTPTLVSDVVEFDLEYRCFVDGKRVTTWSNYICYDNVADPKYWSMVDLSDERMPFDLVNDLIHDLSYHDFGLPEVAPSVIDVGRIKGKGMAIIETNQAWASGIYGCGPSEVLDVLEASCDLSL